MDFLLSFQFIHEFLAHSHRSLVTFPRFLSLRNALIWSLEEVVFKCQSGLMDPLTFQHSSTWATSKWLIFTSRSLIFTFVVVVILKKKRTCGIIFLQNYILPSRSYFPIVVQIFLICFTAKGIIVLCYTTSCFYFVTSSCFWYYGISSVL